MRVVLLVGATPIIAVVSLLSLGAHAPRLPRVGVAGSLVLPTYSGPGLVAGVVGSLAAGASVLLGARRLGGALTAMGALASTATAIIFTDQLRAARAAGAPVRASTFAVRRSPKPLPDRTETYADDADGRPLRVDVYLPPSPGAGPAPLMIYVHGGGWIQGTPDDASADLRWFADHGYVVLAPEYSLATDHRPTWDVAMPQIGMALVWAAANAAQWGADSDRIVMWGGSAGANLALATSYAAAAGRLVLPNGAIPPTVRAVAGEVPAVDPLTVYDNDDPEWGTATRSMVQTYIGGSPADHPERIAAVRVNSYASPAAPPTLLTACVPDHLVPVAGIRDFVTEAERAGVDIRAEYRRWGDHLISARYDGLPNQTMLHLYLRHFRAHGA
ncbi:alpha/beta hydrolase [Microbacterium sp. NPDC019599]|uniref:alpha/beta hydrolase n=1 Tax=Microbacterium sp. NPDC019599 TaxID=3154690 RepID=UPI0033F41667